MSFPHNFLFNIKEERHYKIKFMETFLYLYALTTHILFVKKE